MDKHTLRAFGDRILRKILGRRREEATGCWTTLYNVELLNLY
jgi:hypothetical protein